MLPKYLFKQIKYLNAFFFNQTRFASMVSCLDTKKKKEVKEKKHINTILQD